MTATPMLDKIAAGEALDGTDDIRTALREIIPEAENWVGEKFVLECDESGWSIAYTHGNNYRTRLTDRGYRFAFPEDAIAMLVREINDKKLQSALADAAASPEGE